MRLANDTKTIAERKTVGLYLRPTAATQDITISLGIDAAG